MTSLRSIMLASLVLATIGCGGGAGAVRSATQLDGEVFAYVSSSYSFETNAFVIDAPDGAILIGTTLTPSEALQAKAFAEQSTGKPLALALVLHASHDQFNGTNALRAEGVRVVTSEEVAARAPAAFTAIPAPYLAERFRPDWPERAPDLATFDGGATSLEIAGTTLLLHVLGRGASPAHLIVEWQWHAFVGGLVTNRHHSAIHASSVSDWRERLDEIAALEPRRVHPSRGASGTIALVTQQREYLDEVMRIVRTAIPELPISDEAVPKIVERVDARFPGHQSMPLLHQSLPALYAELSRE